MKRKRSNIARFQVDGKVKYRVQIQLLGKRHSKYFSTERDAIKYREELITSAQLRRQNSRLPATHRVNSIPTVKSILETYINTGLKIKRWSKRHGANVESKFKYYVVPFIGHIELANLTTTQVSYLIQRLSGPVEKEVNGKKTIGCISSYNINKILSFLSAFIKWCGENGLLTPFSINHLRIKNVGKIKEVRIWKNNEIFNFIDKAYQLYEGDRSKAYVPLLYHFAILTGLRYGELAALTWHDLELEETNAYVTVRKAWDKQFHEFKEPKTENSKRKVPLAKSLVRRLKEYYLLTYPPNDHLVFGTKNNRPFSVSNFAKRHLKKDVERIGVPQMNFHGLRHCFGTMLARKNTPIAMIMKLTGHTQLSTVTRYINICELETGLKDQIDGIDMVVDSSETGKLVTLN